MRNLFKKSEKAIQFLQK